MVAWMDGYKKTHEQIDGQKIYEKQMNGRMDRKKYYENIAGWLDGQEKQKDGWMDRKMYGSKEKWVDGWMVKTNRWMVGMKTKI